MKETCWVDSGKKEMIELQHGVTVAAKGGLRWWGLGDLLKHTNLLRIAK